MKNIIKAGTASDRLPTDEEVALRPELVKQLLMTVHHYVNEHDLEHMVAIGITTSGDPRVYHSYGKDLTLEEVVQLLENLAQAGRQQIARDKETKH